MPDFRWTTMSQVCQRGPLRKRTLTMIYICLSISALGLVSLAGCEVHEPGHLMTASETIQVLSLPELLPRPSVSVSVDRLAYAVLWHTYTLQRPFELQLRLVCSLCLVSSFSRQPTFGPGPCLGRTSR